MNSPFLSYDQLSVKQKEEIERQIIKLAKSEGLSIKEAFNQSSVKDMHFCEIAGHLHFAAFFPISMLDL